MNKPRMIAVLAKNKEQYEFHVTRDILPGLEKYHDVKFIKNFADHSYQAPGFKIFYASNVEKLKGLHNWQLIKVGKFYEHPDCDEIIERWEMDVISRKKDAPSLGQD